MTNTQAIIAGISCGSTFFALSLIRYMISKPHFERLDRWQACLSTMIAVNQVRSQRGESEAYSEDEIEKHFKERP